MQRKLLIVTLTLVAALSSFAQERTTFTGTVLVYGTGMNTRTMTSDFKLTLDRTTSGEDASRLLSILQNGGQSDLRNALRKNDIGQIGRAHV